MRGIATIAASGSMADRWAKTTGTQAAPGSVLVSHAAPRRAQLAALARQDSAPAALVGLQLDTLVRTPAGAFPAGDLRPGDVVLDQLERPAMVRDVAHHRIVTQGAAAAIRLRAPYFGLQADAYVARRMPIILSGPAVDYTYATPHVLADAGDLVDGAAVQRDLSQPIRHFATVTLDRPACLVAGRVRLASLTGPDQGSDLGPKIDRQSVHTLSALAGGIRELLG